MTTFLIVLHMFKQSGNPFAPNVQQNGNTLRILNAQPSNRGVYICVAENSEGMDRSYTVVDIDRKY